MKEKKHFRRVEEFVEDMMVATFFICKRITEMILECLFIYKC